MKTVVFYFRHHRTTLLTVGGPGPALPEITHLRLEVDETQNPANAPELRHSYLIEDLFGLRIGCCYWCSDLEMLGETLSGIWWRENNRQSPSPKFAVTKIIHSDFYFNSLGELGKQTTVAA